MNLSKILTLEEEICVLMQISNKVVMWCMDMDVLLYSSVSCSSCHLMVEMAWSKQTYVKDFYIIKCNTFPSSILMVLTFSIKVCVVLMLARHWPAPWPSHFNCTSARNYGPQWGPLFRFWVAN